MIRQPIVAVLGHVDHGKTSILDRIRKTAIAKKEVGGITQHIGASEVPAEVIIRICGKVLKKRKLKIPGLLFIDTPGHEAFTNLRKRGGSVADIAVLVIDITQGFQPQTVEAIDILKNYKTPFIVAANKVDLINGWDPHNTNCFIESFEKQPDVVKERVEEKVYQLVGKLSEYGFDSERFDRVSDFRKQVVMVPLSAKTGEGVAELLAFIAGLSQKYLEEQLRTKVEGPGKGAILEVKEERGLGKTMDIILYDGCLRRDDTIVFGTIDGGVKRTKVRALLKPKPLGEMRESKDKFIYVDAVYAASGVKIYAPGLENALAGSSVFVSYGDPRKLEDEIRNEITGILVERSGPGVILKADTLGSVEGCSKLLDEAGIPIRKAGIGTVTKGDVMEAATIKDENKYYGVVLAFNVPIAREAMEEAEKLKITILEEDVIYALLDDYKKWVELERDMERREAYSSMILPAKIRLLPNCCFRINKPIICGIEVLIGRVKPGYPLMNAKGEEMGRIRSLEKEKEKLNEAVAGMRVAMALESPFTYGRQLKENDILYTAVPKEHRKLLETKYKEHLSTEEMMLLDEIGKISRKGLRAR